MNDFSVENLELNKILAKTSEFTTTDGGRLFVTSIEPSREIAEVERRQKCTAECYKLLYTHGVSKVAEFTSVCELAERASKGSVLSLEELLACGALLRSARVAYESVSGISDEEIVLIRALVDKIYFDRRVEEDIFDKILSPDKIADTASDKLFAIRSKIKSLNGKIRDKLSEYVSGKNAEYLQDAIVTMRGDRYVIPVKAEHKSHVKGFIHDRSKTGATFFIEPEYVLELNNELIALEIDEREEIEAILKALSARVGALCEKIKVDEEALHTLDGLYALAEYSFTVKGVPPKVNNRGVIEIIKGRHPLIDPKKVVPVSVTLGESYAFLLLSGANTGGKTVTLKMVGLFCLMAACGLFLPAVEGTRVAVFDKVFCDVGDSQSIEESLSTFSSHLTNISKICDSADERSLVLIDELGGGTNPDEGQAIAKAVVKHLIDCGAKGIVTTHFTPLKEFAYEQRGIENASMEFDAATLKPLYRIKTGMPGASNALYIARRLGLNPDIIAAAEGYLSDGARSFENIMRRAEDSAVESEKKLRQAEAAEAEWRGKLSEVNQKIDYLNKEKEKIARSARSQSRQIIAERTERAEEILAAIEEIFAKQELSEKDLIAARTLKNKLADISFDEDAGERKVDEYREATAADLQAGVEVFVKKMECRGTVLSFNPKKGEAEVQCGSMKLHLKLNEIMLCGRREKPKPTPKQQVKFVQKAPRGEVQLEINVLGLTVPEALQEVRQFIDKAVIDNLEEVKIIHGVGTGKLRAAISEHLKRNKNVESFRLGKYGEGESGVTFVRLK